MPMAERKFYQLTVAERINRLIADGDLSAEDADILLRDGGLTVEQADRMSENVLGVYGLPFGIAANFIVNGRKTPVPMVIEEPSVIAAASNGARLAAKNGGFQAWSDPPRMTGQIQLVKIVDFESAEKALQQNREQIFSIVHDLHPTLVRLGGGPVDLRCRWFPETPMGPMMIVYLVIDVRDAMGANAVNSAMEAIAPLIESLTGGDARLRILSNFSDQRLVHASCVISAEPLATGDFSGAEIVTRILEAAALAEVDPYRAVTHNKGIMNGIDAVVLASGNDWRAVEAGAHSWASASGRISPLTSWKRDDRGNLVGELSLPMAVGIVGGATRVHPYASLAIKLMKVKTSGDLAEVIASVGLAQNLAALRALVTEGIQKGHMALHARQVAIAAGATGDQIEWAAEWMRKENKIRLDFAKEILKRDDTIDS